jgi:hypothetical protein
MSLVENPNTISSEIPNLNNFNSITPNYSDPTPSSTTKIESKIPLPKDTEIKKANSEEQTKPDNSVVDSNKIVDSSPKPETVGGKIIKKTVAFGPNQKIKTEIIVNFIFFKATNII